MYLIIFIILAFPLVLAAFSYLKFNKSKDLLESLDKSNFYIYKNKNVSTSIQIGRSESFGAPVPCNIFFGENEIHIIPSKFDFLLFGTEFPVTYLKTKNKDLHIEQHSSNQLTFSGITKPSSSSSSKWFEVTITESNIETQNEILNRIKSWR